ncbi:MAG: S8 family serine peptidase [Paracoccus sp. (in: a-proteobacteria)]|nr:S8 family serine peptidase [Paracoccus sp. (in: a-proteobacteria)]
MPKALIALLSFLLALGLGQPGGDAPFGVSAAYADDDDDDDDGGRSWNDDDDDDGPVFRRAPVRRSAPAVRQAPRQQTRRAPPPAPPPPPPVRAANELIARGISQQGLAVLNEQGFETIRSTVLSSGTEMVRLRTPSALGVEQAAQIIRDAGAAERIDYNHYYRTEQGSACSGIDCPARQMIQWPQDVSCGVPPRIGMVDTGLNADHDTFRDAELTIHRLDQEASESGLVHGTAIASLLVGAGDTRSPGLVRHAPLWAVDAFHRSQSDERSDAFSLIEALDWLAANDVRIINLSLAGPDNELLAAKMEALEAQGILVVAAAGNAGPSAGPAYPAAYETVLAVTAVDRRGEVYRRAGRGAHIDLAAPGVDVWTAASISGARTKTGTSFAVPFVAAAAALVLQQRPGLLPAELRAELTGQARDLGSAGRDDVFGSGLLSVPDPCPA